MDDKDLITLTEVVERSKSNTHQIEELKDEVKEIRYEQKAIYDIATSVKLIAQDMGAMKESLIEVKQGQKDLTTKMDEQIADVKKKVDDIDSKGKIDIWNEIIKPKILPVIFSGGFIYAIIEIVKQFIK
jgi:uncharacterized coiled-coil DUF342 family protein